MHKRLRAFVLGCTMTTSAAFAADMKYDYPEMDVPLTMEHVGVDWEGFYAGFNLGYGIGEQDDQTGVPRSRRDLLGAHYGLQAGYNFQYEKYVVGVEAGVSHSEIKTSTLCPNPASICTAAISTIADLRARFGITMDNYLFYGSIGGVYGFGSAGTLPAFPGYSFETAGYSLGLGAEIAVTDNLSAKVDYSYIKFGQVTAPAGTIDLVPINLAHQAHLIKVGLNYRF